MVHLQRNNTALSTVIIISLCLIAITITRQSINLREAKSTRRTTEKDRMSSQQQHLSPQPRENNIVGGYSNLGDRDKSLLKSEQVVNIANFVLKEHAAKTSSANEGGFMNDLLLSVTPDEVESNQVTVVVLEAQRQVVAGLNYKLTIALLRDSICLGALKVTVYDRFGDLSVTKWGDQLTCLDVQDLLNEVQLEEEESVAKEVEGKIEEETEVVEPNE